ncbi:MAG: hypothetical protein HY701_15020 [Gemmatimonadetes bacterium]|nr:hypothetical protein [Gemmatimonadota bacterium]
MPEYATPDLGAAALALARRHRLLRLGGPRERRLFVFPAQAQADVEAFYAGATVRADVYADALRVLKGRLRRTP